MSTVSLQSIKQMVNDEIEKQSGKSKLDKSKTESEADGARADPSSP